MAGSSSSFCMKWQCQRSRPAKARSAAAISGCRRMAASVAWWTQRIDSVP